jgi:hypothetical protein
MKIRFSLIAVIIILFLISCRQSGKADKLSKFEKRKQLESFNLKNAIKLSEKSNAVFGWDTTGGFTYAIQEKFEGGNKSMPFIGWIRDIIKEDSNYVLKVSQSFSQTPNNFLDWNVYTTFAAEILVPQDIFYSLKIAIDERKSLEGCFIIRVNSIKESHPILSSEVDPDGPDIEDASSYITLDFEQSLVVVKGTLSDFYLYDKLAD